MVDAVLQLLALLSTAALEAVDAAAVEPTVTVIALDPSPMPVVRAVRRSCQKKIEKHVIS